jgi:hypothetical protein
MTTETLPTYVEDGRPSQIVRVSELLPGDVLLGWNGEPWTFGRVESVTRAPRQTFGPEPRYVWEIRTDSGDSEAREDGWRRIARRETDR